MYRRMSPKHGINGMPSKSLINFWGKANTLCSSSKRSWLIELQLTGTHSRLGQLACHRYRHSQLQEKIFRTRAWKKHPDYFFVSSIIVSEMFVHWNFYCNGDPNTRLHGSLPITYWTKRFPGIMLICPEQRWTGTNNHQK